MRLITGDSKSYLLQRSKHTDIFYYKGYIYLLQQSMESTGHVSTGVLAGPGSIPSGAPQPRAD